MRWHALQQGVQARSAQAGFDDGVLAAAAHDGRNLAEVAADDDDLGAEERVGLHDVAHGAVQGTGRRIRVLGSWRSGGETLYKAPHRATLSPTQTED